MQLVQIIYSLICPLVPEDCTIPFPVTFCQLFLIHCNAPDCHSLSFTEKKPLIFPNIAKNVTLKYQGPEESKKTLHSDNQKRIYSTQKQKDVFLVTLLDMRTPGPTG